jgi:hypothetical protein
MSPNKIINPAFPESLELSGPYLGATSTTIDASGHTKVFLFWLPVDGMTGYNLYRTDVKGPINGKNPVTQADTCAKLKAFVADGSAEWKMLSDAFSAVTVQASVKVVSAGSGLARRVDKSGLSAVTLSSPGTVMKKPYLTRSKLALGPCAIFDRGLNSGEQKLFDRMAKTNWRLRLARGWAYMDANVVTGQTYEYSLYGIQADGKELLLVKSRIIRAGDYALPAPPAMIQTRTGDGQVLLLWARNNYAYSFNVQRADSPVTVPQAINASPVVYDITQDLDGTDLPSPQPGFLDYQRFDTNGLPADHAVEGVPIAGPKNGITYYYSVASCDILGRPGSWSAPVIATPVDLVPPQAPAELTVKASSAPRGLALGWRKVTMDVKGHQILDASQTYKIYRTDLLSNFEDLALLPAYQVATVSANPTDPATPTLGWLDTDPALSAPYGEKDFWYCLICVDAYGNTGAPSAAIAGRLPDITPPGPTKVTGADSHADHITVFWVPNGESDLAGYQIYRAVCNLGVPYTPPGEGEPSHEGKPSYGREPCDFVLVGEVLKAEADKQMANAGSIQFEDYSVPAGSPLCYAFWVRAFDNSRNLYQGINSCPASDEEYACQRLMEETPPPVPVITALKARDEAVMIEWLASPIQDLRAFHIYRSEEENDVPVFIGGVLTDGTILTEPWKGTPAECGDIPAEVDADTVHASFLDTKAEPNHVYWYRVSALDWLGNESEGADLKKIPAISTFTYTRALPEKPVVSAPPTQAAEGCGLLLSWNPAYAPSAHKGFLVFRSRSSSGNYRQVSPIVQANTYTDASALRGTDYWYRVQAMGPDGTLSEPSDPVKYRY